jgi:putative MATE family efflux protein
MTTDRSSRMGEASIPHLLLTFSVPAVIGMLAQGLYNVVDRVIVGRALGDYGIAGTTVALPYMLVLLAFGMLIGFGAAALVSIRLGQGRRDEAEHVLGNAVFLMLCISFILTVAGVAFLDGLLKLFGASETVLPYARDYLHVIALGTVFQIVGFGLTALIRGEGNPRMAMLTLIISVVLNAILAAAFVFGLGWGMRGAALATVLAQAVAAGWVLAYFLGGRSVLKLHARHLRLRWPICKTIFAIGSPMFAMQLAASVVNGLLNNQLRAYGGDLAISIMGILYAGLMLILMPVFGINQGAQPIIGYNYGAMKFDRVKKALLTAILASTAITLFGFLLMMLFPAQIIRLFTRENPTLVAMGRHAIRISVAVLPLVGFQIISASYFQAVGKPRHALFLGLSRQVLLLMPAVLILPRFFGLDGLWVAFPTADLCASLLTGIWLSAELRHLRRNHEEASAAVPRPVENGQA